jgi:hypothetical protein
MYQYRDYSDERWGGYCPHCGGKPTTSDHIPAKTFLVQPYPANLPTIPACERCNNEISRDEEYLSFLLRHMKLLDEGRDTELDSLINTPRKARLKDMIFDSLTADEVGRPCLNIATVRIQRVLTKYAQGHMKYETGEWLSDPPPNVAFAFKNQLDYNTIALFEIVHAVKVYPDVASRLLQRVVETGYYGWVDVQCEQYRYCVDVNEGVLVKIVIAEKLFGEINWKE